MIHCHFVFLSQYLYCRFVVSPCLVRNYRCTCVSQWGCILYKQVVAKVCEWNTLKKCVVWVWKWKRNGYTWFDNKIVVAENKRLISAFELTFFIFCKNLLGWHYCIFICLYNISVKHLNYSVLYLFSKIAHCYWSLKRVHRCFKSYLYLQMRNTTKFSIQATF